MKTRNFAIFMLTAVLCGALFCTDSQARVCFATDENCGSGGNFPAIPDIDPNNTACENEGYVSGATCLDGYFKYNCPYKSSYVKCCAPKFRYEGCVFPLEVDTAAVGGTIKGKTIYGKCGTRYACKCPAEYGVSSTDAKTRNCQPGGGYCMLNDGATDEIKYKTCTCDRSVYTDESKCSSNQTEAASCQEKIVNSEGGIDSQKTYKKCYCDRSVYKYAACEYGNKGSKCVDSNSRREYYEECKTARERCIDENFIAENLSQCPKGAYGCTSTVTGKQYYCALGDGCPYPTVPQLFKCQFDKGRWCKNKGYTQESSTPVMKNQSCIDAETGMEGKIEPCSENTDTPTYYYRCKLSCAQEVKRAAKNYLLLPDNYIYNDNGVVGYYRTAGSDKHLYIIEDVILPKPESQLNQLDGAWKDIGSKNDYKTVNGMYALYDVDPVRYASCGEERELEDKKDSVYDTRPTIKFDANNINKHNTFLARDMSDIGIQFYASNGLSNGSANEWYMIPSDSNLTWKNVTFKEFVESSSCEDANNCKYFIGQPQRLCVQGEGHASQVYYPQLEGDGKCRDNWFGSRVRIGERSNITFTGTVRFRMAAYAYSNSPNDPFLGTPYKIAVTRFYPVGNARILFKDATIYDWGYTDWDGVNNATMLFTRSKGKMGRVWSNWNVGLENSDITFSLLRIVAYPSADNVFPSSVWHDEGSEHGRYRCHGVYVSNSNISLVGNYGKIQGSYAKMYLSAYSTLNSRYPIVFGGTDSDMICVNKYAKATINGLTYNGRVMIYGYDNNGKKLYAGSNAYVNYIDNRWYNNMYSSCSGGKCKNCSYTPNTCVSGGYYCDNSGGHDYAYYPSYRDSAFCTSCQTCQTYGMGYK